MYELWSAVTSIRVDNLIVDYLAESLNAYLKISGIQTEKRQLSIDYLGNCYLPWYRSGSWALGGQYKVKDYPIKEKLRKNEYTITIVDNRRGKRVIVDGCHRAVAIYQNKPKFMDGYMVILRTDKADYLFPKDVGFQDS